MVNTYIDAQKTRELLLNLINETISNHPSVKSAIKAKKARVTRPPLDGEVGVNIIGDVSLDGGIGSPNTIYLPYNSRLTSDDLALGKIVSVWYNYSLNNGIVMQNANWTK